MKSPADMKIIQIDITNACNKRCSNCTRFCGNHSIPFFMDYKTFKRAVDSLDGYEGVTGVMGGEPTLHPEFERFVRYIREKFGPRNEDNRLNYPQNDFIKDIRRREFESRTYNPDEKEELAFRMHGPGLWSNMGRTYRDKYELIQDSFDVQFLNDHINPSYHQPGLFSRKDLGISDDEWIPMRDKCWVQNEWSATITPKGAFFCEIAGALDMLFDGPGGWQIENGWWKRKPEEFGDQLKWCEICGFALDTFMRDAEEEIDDVSPILYEKLKEIDSPRLKAGRAKLVKIENGVISKDSIASMNRYTAGQPYIENYEDRFNSSNSQLFVHEYREITISDKEIFGILLNKEMKLAKEWVLLKLSNDYRKSEADNLISNYIINPGTIHIGNDFALFSKKASSLIEYGFDRIARLASFDELLEIWNPKKIVKISEICELTEWKRSSVIAGKRYALWGAGFSGGFIADAIKCSDGIFAFAIDSDTEKEGMDFYGVKTHLPDYLKEHDDEYDYIVIGHYTKFNEIKKMAIGIGVDERKIIMPYEI